MDQEENVAPYEGDDYDMMLKLDRLESLREDLEELGLNGLAEVEAALALLSPGKDPSINERRDLLEEMRAEFLDLGVTDLAQIEEQVSQLNGELDQDDF